MKPYFAFQWHITDDCDQRCQHCYIFSENACKKLDFQIAENGELLPSEDGMLSTTVPTELLPTCPKCGAPMTMNLRADDTFVEDEGWLLAAERYSKFVKAHRGGRVLFLELGVGYNTPGIIKYPFWQMTADNPQAICACLNYGEAVCPKEIAGRAICMDGDIGESLALLRDGDG